MLYVLAILTVCILYILYKRYIPVGGVDHQDIQLVSGNGNKAIVDLRDYNSVCGNKSEEALHIPIAYIKRQYQEIPNKHVHIIVDNELEKNIGIRLLRRKGVRVVSYTMNERCD